MGYYLLTERVDALAARYGGQPLERPPATYGSIPKGKALVVAFDSCPRRADDVAAFCYDRGEFQEFTDPTDDRPRRYLLLDRKVVERESGYAQDRADGRV